MNPDVKQKWVDALRSGDYTQGRDALARKSANGDWQHCCLGVLCDVAVKEGVELTTTDVADVDAPLVVPYGHLERRYNDEALVLPESVMKWAGLPSTSPSVDIPRDDDDDDDEMITTGLAELNDEGQTFSRIADLIDEQL